MCIFNPLKPFTMNEAYLQYIWKLKRVPAHNLYTTDGKKIKINNFGTHNFDSGPDFFNGQIEIDGIKWSGNIEIHVKSSDWYQHKHQIDRAYNNVVLHVVYEFDKEVEINGEVILTLELKDHIDEQHYLTYDQLIKNRNIIPCSSHKPYNHLAVFQQMTVALIEREERKARELKEVFENKGKNFIAVLHYTLFSSFGGRVNKSAFQQLANALPFSILLKESEQINKLEALLFGVAGFLESHYPHPYQDRLLSEWKFLKYKHNLSPMSVSIWKFGGIRPSSFPTLRIAQLAQFLSVWKYQTNWKDESETQIINNFRTFLNTPADLFWTTHYNFKKKSKRMHKSNISEAAKQSILINAVVPFLWFLGIEKSEKTFIQKAINLLETLPPERNKALEDWSNLGVLSKNAADSQSLLEQKNQFCTFRRCLACKIGYKILSE